MNLFAYLIDKFQLAIFFKCQCSCHVSMTTMADARSCSRSRYIIELNLSNSSITQNSLRQNYISYGESSALVLEYYLQLRELGFINLRRDQYENLCSTEINALHKLSCPRVVRVGLNCPPIKSLQVQNCHIDSNHDLIIACFRAGLVSTTLDLPVLASDAWGKIKSLISIEWKWQLANLRVGSSQKKCAEKAVSASEFGWCAASAVGTFGYHNKFTGSNLSNMSLLYLHIFLDRNRHPVGFLLPFLHYVWTNSAS